MRQVLIVAAALAAGGFLASTAANAQAIFQPGGPDRIGNMCKVTTDFAENEGYGYYEPCGQQAVAQAPVRHRTRR